MRGGHVIVRRNNSYFMDGFFDVKHFLCDAQKNFGASVVKFLVLFITASVEWRERRRLSRE